MGELSNGLIPDPTSPISPQTGWSKSPPLKLLSNCSRYTLYVNGELIETYGRATEYARSHPSPTRNRGVANRRPQIEHIIMWSCRAAHHHCGDDLVFNISKSTTSINFKFTLDRLYISTGNVVIIYFRSAGNRTYVTILCHVWIALFHSLFCYLLDIFAH